MKVALISGGFPDTENNLKGIFNKRAAIELAKKVDLTVIHYRMLKPGRKIVERTKENGYNLIRVSIPQIPIFNKYTICLNTYLLNIFIKHFIKGFDIIHSVSGLVGISIGRLRSKMEFKHICQIIGSDINFILPNLKKIGCIKKMKGVDQIVCNSNTLKEQVRVVFGLTKNVSVVYRGVDIEKFLNLKKNLEKDIVFLYLGGLSNYQHNKYGNNLKGGMTLMNAWNLVDKKITKNNSIKLLFGGPNTTDNEIVNNWKNELTNKNNVEIIGEIDPKAILKIYNRSNVTIIPSMHEGFPNVGMESFMSGSCVIGSNVGGIPELVDDEFNGLLFDSGKEKELAERILSLFDVKLVNIYSINAKQKAKINYKNTQFAEKYYNLYIQ